MVVDDRLHALDKAVVRPGKRGLLDLELGGHRTARPDDAHVVQALLAAKVELLRTHVQAVQARNARLDCAGVDLLVRARAVVEQRARLGEHHERVLVQMRERRGGGAVEHRQPAVELGRGHMRVCQLKKRGELGVLLRGLVNGETQVVQGLVGQRQLAAGRDAHAVGVADGLAR